MKPSIVENLVKRSVRPIKPPDQQSATDWPTATKLPEAIKSVEQIKPKKRIKEPSNIVDLPSEDIIVRHILPLLRIEDLLNLKLVSVLFRRLTVRYLRSLRRLNLSESKWLTTGQFKFIVSVSHNFVKQLDLSHNLSLNNRFLSRHLIAYRLKALNSVKLNDCHWIDRQSFTVLVLLYGRQLECLECAGCWLLNDDLVELLTSACPSLTSLNLSMIYSLTDRSLFRIAHRCQCLRTLNLRGCWKLSPVGIYWFVRRPSSQLADLQVDQCHTNSLIPLLEKSEDT